MYWILSNELVDEDNDADLSGAFNTNLSNDIYFDEGEEVLSIFRTEYILEHANNIGNMTDHLSIDEVPGLVFSGKLQKLLSDLNVANIQYIDLEIIDTNSGITYDNYKIANVIGLEDCVDEDSSDLTFFDDGEIKFIKKLVLNEEKISPESKIFRLLRDKSLPLVHHEIKEAIENSGITGCVFYKPEDYH
ncbi:MAG: hypothetical protein OQL19_17710 [Gammaproteobacteria bacterium]|nr:hypothetical protein [Gammaproteobacteria bacterium]